MRSSPACDWSGIMRDAPTAMPQSLRTRDGWFAFNLAANLARILEHEILPPVPRRNSVGC